MLQPGFAIDGPDFDPLDPRSFVDVLHVPIRQALRPTDESMEMLGISDELQ